MSTILFGGPANAGAADRAFTVPRTPPAFHPLPRLPVTNPTRRPTGELADLVFAAFPKLVARSRPVSP